MIKTIEINNKEYQFACSCRGTRNGFAHDCALHVNGFEVARGTCNYINRTWERYEFQRVMLCTIRELIDELKRVLLNEFKQENNYRNMTEKRRDEFMQYIADNKKLNELYEVYAGLK